LQYGAEVKGNARSVVTMKYPEFESDDEDDEDCWSVWRASAR
jgi:FK506-binding nuclear protein